MLELGVNIPWGLAKRSIFLVRRSRYTLSDGKLNNINITIGKFVIKRHRAHMIPDTTVRYYCTTMDTKCRLWEPIFRFRPKVLTRDTKRLRPGIASVDFEQMFCWIFIETAIPSPPRPLKKLCQKRNLFYWHAPISYAGPAWKYFDFRSLLSTGRLDQLVTTPECMVSCIHVNLAFLAFVVLFSFCCSVSTGYIIIGVL